jgi:hypothetical protein
MKARRWARRLLGLVGLGLAVGCASTPAKRIQARPDVFAAFPPETQDLVRSGRVALGFTEDMVHMALGSPDRIFRREFTAGNSIVWSYSDYRPDTRYDLVPTTQYIRDSHGRVRAYPDWIWVDRTLWHETERMRLEFRDGRVVGIETETPRGSPSRAPK